MKTYPSIQQEEREIIKRKPNRNVEQLIHNTKSERGGL